MKKKDINVPMPGEEPNGKKRGKHDGPHGEKPKKKKKKHHLFLIIVLLVLIIGILLGLLIDRGILFPGGEGWIGGVVGSIQEAGKGPGPIDINGTITPNPEKVPTTAINESAPTVYITVKGSTIYMNGYEVTPEGLIAQLKTDTYKSSKIVLVGDGAPKSVMDNVRTILTNEHRDFME